MMNIREHYFTLNTNNSTYKNPVCVLRVDNYASNIVLGVVKNMTTAPLTLTIGSSSDNGATDLFGDNLITLTKSGGTTGTSLQVEGYSTVEFTIFTAAHLSRARPYLAGIVAPVTAGNPVIGFLGLFFGPAFNAIVMQGTRTP